VNIKRKANLKSLVEKIVEKNVKNNSDIEERVGYFCHYIALAEMRARSKHNCIVRRIYNKKEDDG
jgi:hypothetical protein